MPISATSDVLLFQRATGLRALLNVGHTLKLFTSNVTPAPDTPRSAFVQPTFAGYAAQPLAGVWGPLTRIEPGLWFFESRLFTFTRTGGVAQVVYGWWVDGGAQWEVAERFAVPIDTAATASIPVVLRFEERSLSLCC